MLSDAKSKRFVKFILEGNEVLNLLNDDISCVIFERLFIFGNNEFLLLGNLIIYGDYFFILTLKNGNEC